MDMPNPSCALPLPRMPLDSASCADMTGGAVAPLSTGSALISTAWRLSCGSATIVDGVEAGLGWGCTGGSAGSAVGAACCGLTTVAMTAATRLRSRLLRSASSRSSLSFWFLRCCSTSWMRASSSATSSSVISGVIWAMISPESPPGVDTKSWGSGLTSTSPRMILSISSRMLFCFFASSSLSSSSSSSFCPPFSCSALAMAFASPPPLAFSSSPPSASSILGGGMGMGAGPIRMEAFSASSISSSTNRSRSPVANRKRGPASASPR
mmetsp:Transcript_15908/g.46757  ORF Transcript_15908/g.46757 Transcript_15908/m.46757 type:complete len:267 (-) Transcript_15908:810-1610(-)